MRTIDYQWYQPPFPEYNKAQASVIPFADKDNNLVISFATSVGKTVLAECCFGHSLQNFEGRVCYVCPFKSIAHQKYSEWSSSFHFKKYGLSLWSRDSLDDGTKGRIIVATMESLDIKVRSHKWRDIIKDIDCIVYDEAHMIGDKSRGGVMESSMMRFSELNPGARIILLSATMGNAVEIAKWVKSLNGKGTKCITSKWRPTKVNTNFYSFSNYKEKTKKAVELVKKEFPKKMLVFVHSKVTGKEITKTIRSNGIRAEFHNASLPKGKRSRIENEFNDADSGLNVIVCTSTLGAGVNMGG